MEWNGSNGLVRSTVSKRDVNSMNQSVSPMLPSQLQQCVAKQIEKTLKRIKNFNTWFFLSFFCYHWSEVYFVLRAHYSFRFGSVRSVWRNSTADFFGLKSTHTKTETKTKTNTNIIKRRVSWSNTWTSQVMCKSVYLFFFLLEFE